jgi:hypothetical protein
MWVLEVNTGPLQEQEVLLNAELSFLLCKVLVSSFLFSACLFASEDSALDMRAPCPLVLVRAGYASKPYHSSAFHS